MYPKQVGLLLLFSEGQTWWRVLKTQHATKLRGFTISITTEFLQLKHFLAEDGTLEGIKDGGMSPPRGFMRVCRLGHHYLDWWASFQCWNCPSLCTVNSSRQGEWHLCRPDCQCVSVSSASLVRKLSMQRHAEIQCYIPKFTACLCLNPVWCQVGCSLRALACEQSSTAFVLWPYCRLFPTYL